MGILRPVRMTRVGILGLKDDRERVLTALHDLRVAQIETLPPETLALLAPERGNELQRKIGDETLRFRGLLAALPRAPVGPPHRYDTVDQILAAAAAVPIDAEVGALKVEDDRLVTEERSIAENLALLGRLSFYTGRIDDLRAQSVLSFFGETEPEEFEGLRAELPGGHRPDVPDRARAGSYGPLPAGDPPLRRGRAREGRPAPRGPVRPRSRPSRALPPRRRPASPPANPRSYGGGSRSPSGSARSRGTGTAPSPPSTRRSWSRTGRSRRSRSSAPAA